MARAALGGGSDQIACLVYGNDQQTASGLVESLGKSAGSPHLARQGVGPWPVGVGVFG